jgi:hypothetical protein
MRKWWYESYFEIYKKYLYCARNSSFGPKTKALKISKKFLKKRSPAHFLAKAKDANQLFLMWPNTQADQLLQLV